VEKRRPIAAQESQVRPEVPKNDIELRQTDTILDDITTLQQHIRDERIIPVAHGSGFVADFVFLRILRDLLEALRRKTKAGTAIQRHDGESCHKMNAASRGTNAPS
jgi:hypothetical protein